MKSHAQTEFANLLISRYYRFRTAENALHTVQEQRRRKLKNDFVHLATNITGRYNTFRFLAVLRSNGSITFAMR